MNVRIGQRLLRGGLGAFVDRQTYRNLLYLLLAVPFGMLYYLLFGIGLVLGLLSAIVLVGVAILVGLLLGARAAAGFERWLANALLGLELRRYDDVPTTESGGLLAGIRPYVDAPSTWRAVGFLSLKTLVAVCCLVGLVLFATIVSLLAAPVRYPTAVEFGEVNGEPVVWSIETIPEAALAGALGAVLLLGFVHAANGVAYVCGRMAVALLGEPAPDARTDRTDEPSQPDPDARAGRSDEPTRSTTDARPDEPSQPATDA